MNNKPRNLIMISIDALRSDCINCNPDKKLLNKYNLKVGIKTPTLDWFAKKGVFFNNCITVAPYTTSAHASILTGQWPYNHGVIDFFRNKLESPTILEELGKRGFKTLFQSDFSFLLGPTLGFTKGVDKFVKEGEEESYNWIKRNKNSPLACFFHFSNVHEPYGFSGKKSEQKDYKKKIEYLLNKFNLKPDKEVFYNQHFITSTSESFSAENLILGQNYKKILNRMHGLGLYSEIMDLYLEGINYFEKKRLRPFIENLKKMGLLENSLFVIFGDHGEGWDKDNKGHNKGNLRRRLIDDNIKIPVLFYGKTVPRNTLINTQIRTIDIAPTIFSLLGYKEKNNWDGINLSDFSNILSDLNAFSHTWHSSSGAITVFMYKTKKKGKLTKPDFDSYLLSASLKKGKWKLVQIFSKRKVLIESYLLNTDKQKKSINKKIIFLLNKILKEYNQKTYNKIKSKTKGQKISSEKGLKLAEQLKSLGYNV